MNTEKAIEELNDRIELANRMYVGLVPEYIEALELAVEALRKQEPVAISKTETTSCKWCKSFDRFEFNPIDHDGNCIPDEYCMVQSGLAAYCPNCGRKIKED